MRRLLLLLLLPVVWLPLGAFVLFAWPLLPWWGWLFGVVFWVLLWRRRSAGSVGVVSEVDPAGPRFSPLRGS